MLNSLGITILLWLTLTLKTTSKMALETWHLSKQVQPLWMLAKLCALVLLGSKGTCVCEEPACSWIKAIMITLFPLMSFHTCKRIQSVQQQTCSSCIFSKKKKKKGLQMTANAFNWFPGLTSASSSGFQGFSKALTTSLCHAIITHKTCEVSSLQLNDRQHQIQSLTAVWLMRNCQKVTEIDSRGRDLLFLL